MASFSASALRLPSQRTPRPARPPLLQTQLAAVSIDLTRIHRRTVTSFYSNLVTRPTGRAVRAAVEAQLLDSAGAGPCLSILDFSQVRVMDYSCADEIVAKLLLRYSASDRPVDAYFLGRGLQAHHLEAVHAVLDRHNLLLAVLDSGGAEAQLLGPCSASDRHCWTALLRNRWTRPSDLRRHGLPPQGIDAAIARLVQSRVAVVAGGDAICALPRLGEA